MIKDTWMKNTIRDGDSTALYTVDTVCTVYTNQTDVLCLNSSMYASMQLGKVRTLLEWADGLLSKMLDGWWMDGWYHLDCFMTTRPPTVLKNPGVSWMLTILSISQWIAPQSILFWLNCFPALHRSLWTKYSFQFRTVKLRTFIYLKVNCHNGLFESA